MILFMLLLISQIYCLLFTNKSLFSFYNSKITTVYTIAIVNLYVFTATEVLSCMHILTFWGISIIYILPSIVLSVFIIRKKIFRVFIDETGKKIKKLTNNLSFFEWMNLFLLLCFIVFEIKMAIATVPYNADSLAYRLPRIVQWSQNKTVAHYATNYMPQVAVAPLPEFIGTHIYLLCEGQDYLLNLTQSISFLLSGAFVYWIADLLVNNHVLSSVGMWIWYTCPIALAESITTQTDLVATLWILLFVYMIIWTIKENSLEKNKKNACHFFIFGILVGLAYNTKMHVLVGMIVFTVLLLIFCIRSKKSTIFIVRLAIMTLLTAAVIALPELIRIYETFGTFFPEYGGSIMLVKTMNPRYLIVNLVKSIAYNLTTNFIPETTNIANKIANVSASLFHVNLNDEAISWHNFTTHDPLWYSHDCVPYPLIMYSFLVALISFIIIGIGKLVRMHKEEKRTVSLNHFYQIGFCICAIVSYFILLIINRHVDANVRYQLVYVSLIIPFIIYMISLIKQKHLIQSLIGGIIVLICFSFINQTIYNTNVIKLYGNNREKGYLAGIPDTYVSYTAVADIVVDMGANDIGIHMPGLFEYPLMKMIENRGGKYIFYNVNVENDTKKYEDENVLPDVLIYVAYDELPLYVDCHGHEYKCVYNTEDSYEKYAVYAR